MEMILLVILSVALGSVSTVFYFTCIKDRPLDIYKKKKNICVPKVSSDEYSISTNQVITGNNNNVSGNDLNVVTEDTTSIKFVKTDNNRKLGGIHDKLVDKLAKIKECTISHKTKLMFGILFIIACISGAWLGYTLMKNVNDVIRDNHKRQTISMVMVEPDCITIKHIDEHSEFILL